MIKSRGRYRYNKSQTFTYGTLTYVIQSDLSAGPGKYRVYRLDSYDGHVRVVARNVTLKQARSLFPKNERMAPHTVIT